MAERSVPSEYQAPLITLANMQEDAVQEIKDALTTEHAAFLDTDLIDFLADTVKGTPRSDLEGLVNMGMWVFAGLSVLSVPLTELAHDLSQSKDLMLSEAERSVLESRLVSILQSGAMTATWKALDLLYEHDKTFYDARIITDVRPLFPDDVTQPPIAAVMTHTLRIHYHHSRRHDELFIALDDDDLDQLQAAIDRARKKAKSLEALLNASGVTFLSPRRSN
ncbi:MAG: hypothetical protein M3437_08335 [Chloroflexota bacterium]|nr:hypothetical protein [Chloroflexota bacterium]MDQ5867180.1 hypothetical protein [Chloroflexota bacterium]